MLEVRSQIQEQLQCVSPLTALILPFPDPPKVWLSEIHLSKPYTGSLFCMLVDVLFSFYFLLLCQALPCASQSN